MSDICEYCNSKIIADYRKSIKARRSQQRFCSKKCARGFSSREKRLEINKIVSEKMSGRKVGFAAGHRQLSKARIDLPQLFCKLCGRALNKPGRHLTNLCNSCHLKNITPEEKVKFSESGRKGIATQKENRRSKNENYFYELCRTKFNNVKANERMFNGWDADVIIEDIKIAVLWNGKWHYQKITFKHSVSQVQNRDKLKIDNIIKCGYTPYVIKDMGKYNPKFVENEFNKFLAR
jgi:DNA-directed RNA polymerase subunit RPC12/RpoP